MLDVLIRNGWVADGAGSPPYLGDGLRDILDPRLGPVVAEVAAKK